MWFSKSRDKFQQHKITKNINLYLVFSHNISFNIKHCLILNDISLRKLIYQTKIICKKWKMKLLFFLFSNIVIQNLKIKRIQKIICNRSNYKNNYLT